MRAYRLLVVTILLFVLTGIVSAQRASGPVHFTSSDVRALDSIVNGGFESGSTGWSGSSTNDFTPICSTSPCGGHPARTGSGFAWLGGDLAGPPDEITSVSQDVTLTANQIVTMSFYLRLDGDGAVSDDTFTVSVDGQDIFTAYTVDSFINGIYAHIELNLSAFADGGTHTVAFVGHDEVGTVTSWLVDDILLLVLPTNGNLLAAPGFEPPLARAALPSPWTLQNATAGKDKIKCDKPVLDKYYSRTGNCAFMFKGGVGEKTKLRQTIPGSALMFPDVYAIDLYSIYWWTSPTAGDNVFATVKFKYAAGSGCPRSIVQLRPNAAQAVRPDMRIGGPLYYTPNFLPSTFGCAGTVLKIKVTFKHVGLTGKQFLDDVGFLVNQETIRDARGVLPVPIAP